MIVINGKEHRNMPEQVAKNQKDIEDIFNTLDGLNIQDNVVAIADLSHIMTHDELEIVERAVAFIVYNDHLYIKRDQDATNAYFDIVFSISGSTVISFNSDKMQVNLTTGALTHVSNTFNTYSKTELDTQLGAKADKTYVDSQLALKANLNGANFTGAITAPSIIENMSGYSMQEATIAKITLNAVYGGIVKNGNKLTIAYATNIVRTDTIIPPTTLCSVVVPNDVGSKIFVNVGLSVVARVKAYAVNKDGGSDLELIINFSKATNTDFNIIIVEPSQLTLNTNYYLRFEITLLLSDNLLS